MTKQNKKDLCKILVAAVLFVLGNAVQAGEVVRFGLFFAAFLVAGLDVLINAVRNITYGQVFDESKEYLWTPSMVTYRPDIVVIYLGTNDFSCNAQPHEQGFRKNYLLLLNKIVENYGKDIPILCMASPVDPYLYDYVRSAAEASGLKNIAYMAVSKSAYNQEGDLGASWHPNYKGHLKVASCMIPYISTLTGWAMEEKPYR